MPHHSGDPAEATPPWSSIRTVEQAWALIGQTLASRGCTRSHIPSYSQSHIAAAEKRVGSSFPPSFREFLGTHDEDRWADLLNPDQFRIGEVWNLLDTKGNKIEGDHPSNRLAVEPLIWSPDHVGVTHPTHAEASVHLGVFVEYLDDKRTRPSAWRTTELLKFAGAQDGMTFHYALSPPEFMPGAVLLSIDDDPGLVWVADSIPQWLARIACCGGVEYALYPGAIHELEEPMRTWVVSAFRLHNPDWEWFDGSCESEVKLT